MRAFIVSLLVIFAAQAEASGEYCLALRGNGELAPAHWGALGSLVEKLGLPAKQAGGSSASITMFLNEAVATNFLVRESSGEQQNLRAAFLIKSFEGFADRLTMSPEWKDFLLIYQGAQRAADWSGSLKTIFEQALQKDGPGASAFIAQNMELIKRNFRTGLRLGLISEKNYAPLIEAVTRITQNQSSALMSDLVLAKFYSSELYQAVSVFGSFDAQTDDNLFFRPGVVDFERFAEQIGKVATFYSTVSASASEQGLWRDLISECATKSQGLTWNELVSANPDCGERLGGVISAHFSAEPSESFVNKTVGTVIPSFPTTSVLVGTANDEARTAMQNYRIKMQSNFGLSFKLTNTDEVKFGYWGNESDLRKIDYNLPKTTDEKSRRFLGLGIASWKKVLSLSPAEPGLASLQTFEFGSTKAVSAGGWSDLHPVLVLKAAGCERVVYVTRRGGESMFGQGVAKRLLNLNRKWSDIKNLQMNNSGDLTDLKSDWSLLYNLVNRRSSISQALQSADAVLCTDWDRFKVTNGIKDLIKDAYKSPFFVRNRAAFSPATLIPELNPRDMHPDGYPIYAGCFAP